MDFEHERKLANGNWEQLLADIKTIKISLKANARTNALGFVFHKQGANLLKTKGDIEHDVRVLLGGMANEELFFGEQGTTNGAHNDITRVTELLHHAVGELGIPVIHLARDWATGKLGLMPGWATNSPQATC